MEQTSLLMLMSIRDVLKLLQQHFHISFEEAALKFYKSETYKTLQETENGLWAESAEYIADRYYDEISPIVLENLSGKSAFDK